VLLIRDGKQRIEITENGRLVKWTLFEGVLRYINFQLPIHPLKLLGAAVEPSPRDITSILFKELIAEVVLLLLVAWVFVF
jgi:hypothetical protein